MNTAQTINAKIINLTPAVAADLMRRNKFNRPLSKNTVDIYTKAMKRGEWQLNGEPIIIFKSGNMGDGQHRCRAVIAAGVTIQTLLVEDVEDSTFITIDSGKMRNAADVLAIGGEINTSKLAAAARAYLAVGLSGRDVSGITTLQIKNCVECHPEIKYWVQMYSSKRQTSSFLPSSFCGFMAMASEKHGRHELRIFLDQLHTGTNLHDKDPALVLRSRLQGQTKTSRLTAATVNAYIIKAINAFLAGRKLSFLRHSENEAFPKIE